MALLGLCWALLLLRWLVASPSLRICETPLAITPLGLACAVLRCCTFTGSQPCCASSASRHFYSRGKLLASFWIHWGVSESFDSASANFIFSAGRISNTGSWYRASPLGAIRERSRERCCKARKLARAVLYSAGACILSCLWCWHLQPSQL